jgi:hypothetical protein
MKKIDLGQTLGIVANLSVLVGLLLVVYQLNQNRQLAQAQFASDRDIAFQTTEAAMLGANLPDAWQKSISDPKSLSIAEIRSLDSWYAMQIIRLNNMWQLEQSGLAEHGATREAIKYNIPFYFGNPFAFRWWSYERENWPSEFAELVDDALEKTDQSRNMNWIRSLRNDFASK